MTARHFKTPPKNIIKPVRFRAVVNGAITRDRIEKFNDSTADMNFELDHR